MSDTPTTAAEWLQRAKAAYTQGLTNYRDALLETGRLLHEYVLAWLHEADDRSRRSIQNRHLTREAATKAAATSLEMSQERINKLVAVAMVVELLGNSAPLGSIGLMAVSEFWPTIRRGKVSADYISGEYRQGHPQYFQETWHIKDGLGESGPALFRRAAEGGWSRARARSEVLALVPPEQRNPGPGPRCKAQLHKRPIPNSEDEGDVEIPHHPSFMEQAERSVSAASPGDVAEMCMTLVGKSEDPAAVAIRLRVMLQKYLPKKLAAV